MAGLLFFSFPQKWVIDSKDAKRQFRNSLHCSLTSIFESWRRETDRCFEDWAEEESKGFGKGVLECFFEHLKKHGGQRDQLEPDPVDYSSSPLAVDFVLDVYGACFTKGLNRTEALTFVLSYFRSTDLNTIPFNRISSMLWAALARKAASGQVHPPSRGMHQDIETISVLLPYCHAMFLDKQCHAFLNDEPLRSELKYGTRIFSLRNEEEFSDYLDQIEQSVPEEHLAALEEVYGERKPKPNTSLFSNGKTL